MRRATLPVAALAGAVAAATIAAPACRHAGPPPATAPAAPPAMPPPEATPAGTVSVRFLAADGAAAPALPPGQNLVAPFAMARPMPGYPADALAAQAQSATVVVRILVDTAGRVASVTDSPLAASTASPFAHSFRAAVETALRAWEFYPGHIDTTVDRDTDGDGTVDDSVLVQYSPVEVYYDVSFEFGIVDGRGTVRLAPAPAP